MYYRKGCQPSVRTGEKGVSISLARPTNLIGPQGTTVCTPNCERCMSGNMMEVSYEKDSDTKLLCIF